MAALTPRIGYLDFPVSRRESIADTNWDTNSPSKRYGLDHQLSIPDMETRDRSLDRRDS